MNKSSDRRKQILAFIRSRAAAGDPSPSLDEIAAASGLASRSAAQKHVKALEQSGELEITHGKARSTRPKKGKAAAAGAISFFEISAGDIAVLQDADLRELVARLCIARAANAGFPSAHVTWGGDQRAPDGGIDVRVQLPSGIQGNAGFSRASVGFQVKATKMGASAIRQEMCPSGLLRPSISDLVRSEGCYIIATSDSSADEEYRRRVDAMRDAVATEPGYELASFDYYDARRLADWTNEHPGVVAWIRSRLGRSLQGWQPHGQWSHTRGGKAQPFLPDKKHRLTDPHDAKRVFALVEGIAHVRGVLQKGGSSVRLTGLSGVGKTRFAQALFEEDAAPNPLAEALAIYTDTADSPDPAPLSVLNELLAMKRRAVLVVDNCGSQLHNLLTTRCKTSTLVSVLTIEYDIREELSNETNVFRLETGSSELIERLIQQQFPHISHVNVATITKFADGNSRVAIALANTLDRNESLAGLSDTELFERLFWLGKAVQHELMVTAQVCALVYSFNVEDLDGEMTHLAALSGHPVETLYRHVSDLGNRGLAQQRGVWRAVLPHAVANTLAKNALESIPLSSIHRRLVQGSDRLLQSFSRRLGYLHESEKAAGIVRGWLREKGLLGDVGGLTPSLIEVLTNVAPVAPEETLAAIECAVTGQNAASFLSQSNSSRTRIIRLVRSIAYEPEYFNRCLNVLVAFALAEERDNRNDATRTIITSLFHLYLSGTKASLSQRAAWIKAAIHSPDPNVEALACLCLSAALECHHFYSSYEFEFGARARDYGLLPQGVEIREWFAVFIAIAVDLGRGNTSTAEAARDLLARSFRALWSIADMANELEAAAIAFSNTGWEKGWLAIRQTIQFDAASLPKKNKARLRALEARAKPASLVGRVRAIVLNSLSSNVDFADGEHITTAFERADDAARKLGELVVADADAFANVLPLVVRNEQGRQWMFGSGLAAGAESLDDCWLALVTEFESVPEDERNIQVLRGFLHGVAERDTVALQRLLDRAMDRALLAKWAPVLQLSVPLDHAGCVRLLASMDNPAVPSWMFQYLGMGRATENIDDATLAQLLQRLSIKPDGVEVAIEVLSMHTFGDHHPPVGPEVTKVARSILKGIQVTRHNQRIDFTLKNVIEFFLSGPDGEPAARVLLSVMRKALEDHSVSRYDLTESLAALFRTQPMAALSILVGDEANDGNAYVRRRGLAGGRRSSALAGIPRAALMNWCEAGGPERWINVSSLLPAFETAENGTEMKWSETVLALLERAPQPIDVAKSLVDLILPTSWSGSRAEMIKQRMPLLDRLADFLGPQHADEVALWRRNLTEILEREARRELEDHRSRDERFE